MIPLYDLLLLKYPSITIGINCPVQLADHKDNNGSMIIEWNVPNISKPTSEDLQEWQNDLLLQQQYQFQLNKQLNITIYNQLDEIDNKSIRALRTNDVQRLTSLENEAAQLRAQLLPIKLN